MNTTAPDKSAKSAVAASLADVRSRVGAAERAAGREAGSVTLIAVSKTRPPGDIAAAASAGQVDFGENYVDEGIAKIATAPTGTCWHFIGRVQSNKTTDIARHFDWVHSVDREKIARRLSAARIDAGRQPLSVCIQVNLDAEPQKGGVSPGALPALVESCAGLPGISLRGLMLIPEAGLEADATRARYAQLRGLLERTRDSILPGLDTLSMGMTNDFATAIAEGATHVRIGRAIFGERT